MEFSTAKSLPLLFIGYARLLNIYSQDKHESKVGRLDLSFWFHKKSYIIRNLTTYKWTLYIPGDLKGSKQHEKTRIRGKHVQNCAYLLTITLPNFVSSKELDSNMYFNSRSLEDKMCIYKSKYWISNPKNIIKIHQFIFILTMEYLEVNGCTE